VRLSSQQQVVRLEVAVDDLVSAQLLQPGGEVLHEPLRLCLCARAARGDASAWHAVVQEAEQVQLCEVQDEVDVRQREEGLMEADNVAVVASRRHRSDLADHHCFGRGRLHPACEQHSLLLHRFDRYIHPFACRRIGECAFVHDAELATG